MPFLVGSLVLIVLNTVLQPNAVRQADTAGGVTVGLLKRLLSADVAGMPQAKGPVAKAAQSALDAARQAAQNGAGAGGNGGATGGGGGGRFPIVVPPAGGTGTWV